MRVEVPEDDSAPIQFWHEHGAAKATPMPSLSLAAYIHEAYVAYDHRGQGLGKKYHEERLKWFKDRGYHVLHALVYASNTAELRIMAEFGWSMVKVGMWYSCTKDLQEK